MYVPVSKARVMTLSAAWGRPDVDTVKNRCNTIKRRNHMSRVLGV
jgi:hypothetical protein